MRWGIYIAGPGIVGEMLMRGPEGPLVFDNWRRAADEVVALRWQRPYHHVNARLYRQGDERLGEYAAHPDGYA